MRFFSLGFAVFALLAASPGRAQTPVWAQLAREDLAAARALIADNHPAAVVAHGDREFLAALRDGFAEASAMADRARDYAGYRGALMRFAAVFGDGHIWSNPVMAAPMRWPGFVVGLVDGRWQVLAHSDATLPPAGSTLLSCDGRDAEALADERVGRYVQGWSIPAQRSLRSVRLLLDRGEGALPPLQQCAFRKPDGSNLAARLDWRAVSSADFSRASLAGRPMADQSLGLARWRDGWWIRLGTLSGTVSDLVEQVQRSRAEIVAAPYVVIDMRGNGGGASMYADRIAALLLGSARVRESEAPASPNAPSGSGWRVSPDNLATLGRYMERFRDRPEAVAQFSAMRDAMERAAAEGRSFAYQPRGDAADPTLSFPAPARAPRLVLVTDGRCFSSCLLAADLFRRLGALHVGQPTNANTHYSEVREITLPSGLSTFSTLQAFMPGMARQIGPFQPSRLVPDGVVADDALIKDAVAAFLA